MTAFSQSDASVGLAMGSFFGLLITILLYMVRRVMTFRDCMSCIPDGFKSMVPAILILTFAWTLKSMTDSLGAADFVANAMQSVAGGFMNFLPAFPFLHVWQAPYAETTVLRSRILRSWLLREPSATM